MSLESIAAIAAQADLTPLSAPRALHAVPQANAAFESVLSAMGQLNSDLISTEQGLQSVAGGNVDNLHQSMMGMERTRLELQLLLQVRSRALDAYQELMRMQV